MVSLKMRDSREEKGGGREGAQRESELEVGVVDNARMRKERPKSNLNLKRPERGEDAYDHVPVSHYPDMSVS